MFDLLDMHNGSPSPRRAEEAHAACQSPLMAQDFRVHSRSGDGPLRAPRAAPAHAAADPDPDVQVGMLGPADQFRSARSVPAHPSQGTDKAIAAPLTRCIWTKVREVDYMRDPRIAMLARQHTDMDKQRCCRQHWKMQRLRDVMLGDCMRRGAAAGGDEAEQEAAPEVARHPR